jgi:hypothetical protein
MIFNGKSRLFPEGTIKEIKEAKISAIDLYLKLTFSLFLSYNPSLVEGNVRCSELDMSTRSFSPRV